ncbi:MAG: hypothetical protein IPG63_17925 [Xanthomonadales bacterium]|nr:hypothetical protein [Xanthomonadales bacterium]
MSGLHGDAREQLNVCATCSSSCSTARPCSAVPRCGFGARAHHWQCPGCKSWSTIEAGARHRRQLTSLWWLPALALLVSPLLTALWIRRAQRLQCWTRRRRRLRKAPTPRGGGIGPVAAIPARCWPSTRCSPHTRRVLLAADRRAVARSRRQRSRTTIVRARCRCACAVHLLAATAVLAGGLHREQRARWQVLVRSGPVAGCDGRRVDEPAQLHGWLGCTSRASRCSFSPCSRCSRLGTMQMPRLLLFAAAAACGARVPCRSTGRLRACFSATSAAFRSGFLVAAFSLVAVDRGLIGWGGALILSSGFAVDAAATLFQGACAAPPLAQAASRSPVPMPGSSRLAAARVVARPQGWNLLIVLPALALLELRAHPPLLEFLAVAVYGLGIGIWIAARRALRRAHRAQ